MITKTEAEKLGIKTIKTENILLKQKKEVIAQLKQLAPNIVNSDNIIDTRALEGLFGKEHSTYNHQGLELTFAGKGIARAQADKPTTKELQLEKKQSKDFGTTENLIIRGDNIDALKILKANYTGKIKMIYIDPPYNTTNDSFIYNDNFRKNEGQLIEEMGLEENTTSYLHNVYGTKSHSGWLAFIYPRLKLARDLLTDDGAIFISIDDNEQAQLKLLMDEIFGEECFIVSFLWTTKNVARGVPPTTMVMSNHEYILCYSKSVEKVKLLGIDRDKKDFHNPDNDIRGLWRSESMRATGAQKNQFTVKDPKTNREFTSHWAFSKTTVEKMIEEDLVIFPKKDNEVVRQKKFMNSYKNEKKAIVSALGWYSTENSTKRFMEIFDNRKIFDFPKPLDIIKFIIQQSTQQNDIILDFFAGSGTTADAVIQLNAKDGGNRKFILCQLDEKIDDKKSKEAYDFCKENKLEPFISSICVERINRSGNKIKEKLLNEQKLIFENEKKNVDIGYKVFSLKEKPKVNYQEEKNQLSLNFQRIDYENTLYNMLVTTGKPLHTKIQEVKKSAIYLADNSVYILGQVTKEEIASYQNYNIFLDGYLETMSLQDFLNFDLEKENIRIIY